ncbi:hypothetical protein BGZ99_002678 [Dissophora globulifera]|uniref:Sodium/calcium exchanger membrane region domain-containing protein n=1 Tax=Dissophora globulifera TaxID=979702 RepID=A0A9P6RMH2_9FUNG|nr:hypothetical protein BGZ99_002678 [Dissophora globulifera]
MSQPHSGSIHSQPDLQPSSGTGHPDSNNRYLTLPVLPPTTSLLSAQETSTSSYAPNAPSSPSPSSSSKGSSRSKLASSRRNKPSNSYNSHSNINNDSHLSLPSSATAAPSDGLRPQRSLVMKHRLRRINDFYEDQTQQQQPPLPQDVERSNSGGAVSLSRRRAGSYGKSGSRSRRGAAGSSASLYSQPSSGEMDTSGLLNYIPDADTVSAYAGVGGRAGAAGAHEMQSSHQQQLTTIDLEDSVDEKAQRPLHWQLHDEHHKQGLEFKSKSESREKQGHHHTLTELLHGDRPDRNLFPYRNRKDNVHALRTFLRRFYFVLLIIPAWIIPNVLTAQLEHEQQQQQGEHGAGAEGEGGGGGGAHGVMLSKWVNMLVFLLNLLAMMHLGKAAGACMEELVPKFGMSVVSIFDAMTSSSVELAVAAFALMKGLVRVVQAAMLGAILNNLLLMMGLSLMVGGYYHNEQAIQADTSQTGMNLLMIVCISYVIPVALDTTMVDIRMAAIPPHLNQTQFARETLSIREEVDHDVFTISKIMAIIMLILYGCCLLFQYSARSFMVTPEVKHTSAHTVHHRHVHYWFAGFGYSVMLAAQIYSANLLVHSVESLGKQFELNDSFVGFVLLPIVLISDLQEEVIAIKESRANRLDRSIALMIGSCMQIALLVTPLLVLLGWAIDVPMTFRFSILEAAILAGSVLMVNYLIQDNQTNWLEGCMLLAAFFMCAMAFYFDFSSFEPLENGGGHGGESSVGGGGTEH